MQKSYTYIVTNTTSGQFYIGSRGANKVSPANDLWKIYFTSSKVIHEQIKQRGANTFSAIIVNEYDTPNEAFIHEQQLIKDNMSNPLCLNQQFREGTTGVFLTTNTKRTVSQETREKISKSLKNGAHKSYTRTSEHIAILSENGKHHGGWNKGMSYHISKVSAKKGQPSNRKGQSMPQQRCHHCGRSIGGAANFRKHVDKCSQSS